ncbi:MAG TPA: hypothetical protein VG294_07805 [Solirubrobacteraceae bacterium]|nr:hypothetical protein [Solirubrobacteraceae bacterium]
MLRILEEAPGDDGKRSRDGGGTPATVLFVSSSRELTSGTLIPVHVGFLEPQSPANQPTDNPMRTLKRAASALRDQSFDWKRHGLEPRWIEFEASDCAAAIEPNIFHNHGADELARFRQGAARRGETALLIAVVGDRDGDERPRSVLSHGGDSVSLPGLDQSIGGPRLPRGASVSLVDALNDVDRDLGLRLRNGHPADGLWWELKLAGHTLISGAGLRLPIQAPTSGTLQPILVDGLGHATVAVWTPEATDERWYVIPDGADWHTVLDWLVDQALPEYVPAAVRRARPALTLDASFRTQAEAAAHERLAKLDADHTRERARLETELKQAEAAAGPIREALLFGSNKALEAAVASVLRDASVTVVELDAARGDTSSADLLISRGSEHWLAEVKSASGRASEVFVAKLLNHLQTWPRLEPTKPVSGAVLIVNNQHREHPADRDADVYQRREFVESLTVPVISTVELFNWWRKQDWAAIHAAMFASTGPTTPAAAPLDAASAATARPSGEPKRWFRRGSNPSP